MNPLSHAQEAARSAIMEMLDTGDSRFLVVRGPSGVGKSTLADAVRDVSGAVLIDDTRELSRLYGASESLATLLQDPHHILLFAGIPDAGRIATAMHTIMRPLDYDIFSPSWNPAVARPITYVDLKGMDLAEATAYAGGLKNATACDSETLARAGVGLPGLMRDLSKYAALDWTGAVHISARALRRNVAKEDLRRFLSFEPAEDILHAMERSHSSQHIYDCLWGEEDADTTFISPESAEIYTACVRGGGIHAVSLCAFPSDAQYGELIEMIGFTHGCDNPCDGLRWVKFDAQSKEVQIYARSPGGEELLVSEYKGLTLRDGMKKKGIWLGGALVEDTSVFLESLLKSFREKETWMQEDAVTAGIHAGNAVVALSVNDHGCVTRNPLRVGFMMETFLQQHGIPYLGELRAHDPSRSRSYAFTSERGLLIR